MAEVIEDQELNVLQEDRDKAFENFFTLDEDTDVPTNDPLKWSTPQDAKERLKTYVKSELALQQAKIRSASPRYDTDALSSELMFQNADRFLEDGKEGKVGLEKVLTRLYKFQKERELNFGRDPSKKITDSPENMKEWNNILACQRMVSNFGRELIDANFQKQLTTLNRA